MNLVSSTAVFDLEAMEVISHAAILNLNSMDVIYVF